VAVTGARGFIGKTVCRALADASYQVIAIDLRPSSNTDDRLVEIVGDAADPAIRTIIAACGTLVHLAGLPGVQASWAEPARYWDANVVLTRVLLETLVGAPGCRRVILFSSSSVYGPGDLPAHEQSPLAPQSPYGATKLAAEIEATRLGSKQSLQVLRIRPFTVYGEGQRDEMAVARLFRSALDGTAFPSVGSPDAIARDWTYVGDVGAVVARLVAMRGAQWPQILNLASGRLVQLATLAEHVEALVETRISWDIVEPVAIRHIGADISLLRTLIPEYDPIPLADGLARQLAALQTSGVTC
jgi:UDP-glucuronate 4-epimerase